MKRHTLRKKNRTKIYKKQISRTRTRTRTRTKPHKRKTTISKRGGGDFVEPIKTYINILKDCDKKFHEPSEDKPREINRSLQSLGIPLPTNITEKLELIKYYGDVLSEYIEDKREIFFDVVDKLVLDNKIPNSEFPKQNIDPTLCCMSLLEKIKAINRMASESFKEYFNPANPNKKKSRDAPYVIIDRVFLENLKERPNPQDTRVLEEFLEHYLIDKPVVTNTKAPEALNKYVDDLIQLFNTRGSYARVDETVVGVLKKKIRNINEDKQKAVFSLENEKKQQEELKRRQEEEERERRKRQEEMKRKEEEMKRKQEEQAKQAALEKEQERQKLYRIIEGSTETGGLFGDARNTLKNFSVDEKKLIIKRLSPDIRSILDDQDVNIDNLLIEILHHNFKEREKYMMTQPKMGAVRDRNGATWVVIYSLLPGTENGKKIIGRKMYQNQMNGQVREALP
jgi:Skp family chaperone for outer membrane proteins